MAKLGDTLTTREALVTATLDTLVAKANEAAQTIEGGALDGIAVVSLDRLRGLAIDVGMTKLPPPSDRYAEVLTPAEIKVTAPCPECHETVTTTLEVHPQLIVENNVRKIKIKGKAEPVVHMHGQLPLTEAASQETVDEALERIEDLRLRILRAVADVSDRHADEQDPGPIPSLEAVAAHLELASDGDRGDLEESLYSYAQLDEPLVEIVSVKGEPVTYVLTEAGLALVAAADDVDGEGEDLDEPEAAA
jgi:hypothetical protein